MRRIILIFSIILCVTACYAEGGLDKSSNNNSLPKEWQNPTGKPDGSGKTKEKASSSDSLAKKDSAITAQYEYDGQEGEDDSDNEEAAQQEQEQAEQEGSSSGGSNFMALLAILFCAVIAFYLYRKEQKEKAERLKAGRQSHSNVKPVDAKAFNNLAVKVDGLSNRVSNLEQSIAQLSSSVSILMSRKETPDNGNPKPHDTAVPPKPGRKEETFYAKALNGDTFQTSTLTTKNDKFTIFVLNVADDEGTYSVNDAPDAQRNLISGFQYAVAKAVDIQSKVNAPGRVVTLQPGTVRKTAGGWKITKKAVVELK